MDHLALYTDGGLIGTNPSSRGFSWAFCRVENGERVMHAAGWVRATELPPHPEYGHVATGNQAEFYAALMAMESLAPGEQVHVYTDSEITIARWARMGALNGIPPSWRLRQNEALKRCGGSYWHHLDGHPSTKRPGKDGKTDLERGHKLNGDPVSEHNVFVDALCTAQSRLGELVLETELETGERCEAGRL